MTLKEILAKNSALYGGPNQNYGIKKYSLPNDTGSYSAGAGGTSSPAPVVPSGPLPGLGKQPIPLSPTGGTPTPVPTPVKKPTPTFTGAPAPTPTKTGLDYSKYTNPETGQPYTPKEYADIMATKAQGGVQSYASGAIAKPDQTIEELNRSAYGLNNAANDIATGATDPYGVASKSGIQYTPAELSAIENAYAGVYSPALADVFTKIDTKQKEAASALEQKNELERMAKQFGYDKALKQLPTYADTHPAGGALSTGAYVPGANPAVDAWAQRIFDGTAKITDIPATQKGMRDAVTIALQASGNDLAGKPTVTELGKKAKLGAEELMRKFTAGEGTSAVGKSRIFGGSLAFPGSAKSNLVIDFQNLKDMLSLEGVKYLKGQGQVSDAERALLANAITKLNLSQSEDEFKGTLQGIIDTLSGKEKTPVEVDETKTSGKNITTAPDGTLIELTD